MPRGRKSKRRARERRRRAQRQAQRLQGAQAPAAEEPQGATATCSPEADVSCPRSGDGAKSQDEESASASGAAPSTSSPRRSPLDQKAFLLVQFMLRKYNLKEPITKEDMMKHVIKQHQHYFHEILKKASELMVLAFGIDVKEVDPARHCYGLVNKLRHAGDESLRGEIMPKMGLLMTILCVIFMKGNCASEQEIWDVLNAMGVHAGEEHFVHGEPMKLITEDLVQEGYLVYRQVAGSNPPHYQFLWGPRAHAEITKMEVLKFLAKLHDTHPGAFPVWYEEALRDEEERTRARFAAMARTGAPASVPSRANFNRFSHMY
ncbi:melanoma-associated antigen B10-like [Molossus molossus]|uniref:melanoma-associated antigen B10-like n=1 Tax=Molossus molossus TaxID=27622 RepID=UPI00174743A5|nr:melanoma-associated antigen B10-like [Molossus molossus]XP_036127696.1 melanoma-associated antigen B10-like [Molossus molossus]